MDSSYIWVDFNDLDSGGELSTRYEQAYLLRVGQIVTIGDCEGNRAIAKVTLIGSTLVWFRLHRDTFRAAS